MRYAMLEQHLQFIRHAMHCLYVFFVFTVSSPPYSPVDPAATVDYTATEYDYFTDDRTPTVELQASRAIPLSHISPTYLYFSVALGICCCYDTSYSTA